MTGFGRVLDTTGGNFVAGAPMAIEAPVPINTFPELNLDGMPNLIERPMFNAGAIDQPPQNRCWTNAATGGCVPICAAEVTGGMARQVHWTYLFHGHYPNMGINIVQGANNANDVYVAFLLYSPRNPVHGNYDFAGKSEYFRALDPNNQIPNLNTLLIYGDYSSLGMTPNGYLGVLPGNREPTPPGKGGGGSGKKCFITTATCGAMGLPDDCPELLALRWYRDHVLVANEQGRAAIAEYYALAPEIVTAINRREDAARVYAELFQEHIAPAAEAIRSFRYGLAFSLFRNMVRLASRHLHVEKSATNEVPYGK